MNRAHDSRRRAAAAAAALACALCGCAEIDPVPTPGGDALAGHEARTDAPTLDTSLVVVSASRTQPNGLSADGDGLVLVAGLPAAFSEGTTRAIVRNMGTTAAADVPVNPDGSFAAVVPASAFDQLAVFGRIDAPNADAEGDPVVVAVPRYDPAISPATPATGFAPGDVPSAIDVAVSGPGEATVTGSAASLLPGTEVVVADVAISTVALGPAREDGSFSVTIEARPGDPLVIFSRRPSSGPGDPGSASDAISASVPAE